MEYMVPGSSVNGETQAILCCQCGTLIEPNPANTCVACLRTQVDVTEGIPKQYNMYFCKFCERYLQPPSTWVSCALESRELLALCLKKVKGLGKVKLVDAGFVWTEPHSKRIKVKLTVQKEVLGSTILQQVFVVEYIVHYQMCDECRRHDAQDFWRAVVQVRQKTSHKKTFLYLEQLILKHRTHTNALRIKECAEGLDFYYAQKQDARKLVDFLNTVVPCRYKTSQELISHDIHNNTFNYKHTFSVEIVPVCKDDVLCLPLKLSRSLGNLRQVVVCTRVTTALQLVDPFTAQVTELSSGGYWRSPFASLCDHRDLREFYVVQIEPVGEPKRNDATTTTKSKSGRHSNNSSSASAGGNTAQKGVLADAWVVLCSELGGEGGGGGGGGGGGQEEVHCRTHLGHILAAGDLVWGFDFRRTNVNDANLERMKPDDVPDIVLVKKSYGDKRKRHRQRNWRLQQLDKEMGASVDQSAYDRDYMEFLEDLEEDKLYRKNVNIYYNPKQRLRSLPHAQEEAKGEGEGEGQEGGVEPDTPRIGLEEMLQELTISDPGNPTPLPPPPLEGAEPEGVEAMAED